MEGDTIRTSSSGNVLIDLWIEGAMRELVVTGEAIAAAAGAEAAATMSDDQRRDFVRTRMSLVQAAARTAIAEQGRNVTRLHLKAACLVDPSLPLGGERRRGGERRQPGVRRNASALPRVPVTERRKTDRRRGDRRGMPIGDVPA